MNTNTNLIFAMPAAQDTSATAADAGTAVESATDGAVQHADQDEKFGSILHTQLQEEDGTPALNLLSDAINEADLLVEAVVVSDLPIEVDPSPAVDPSASVDPLALIDPSAVVDPSTEPNPAILPDPLANRTATETAAVVDTGIKLNVDSLEITEVNSLTTASNDEKPVITVAQEANTLLEASKIASAEINLEEAKNGAHIELSTVSASSKASPAGPIGLETQVNNRLASNSPVAGSPATLADEVMLSSRQAVNVEEVSVTESEQTQWSGKLAPPRGNTLPGNLPFLTNSDGKSSQIENVSDLINKAVFQSQQISQSSESKAILQQTVQSEATPTALNVGNLVSSDKAAAGRNPGAFNVGSTSSFVVESPAGSTDWNNQVGDRIRWMGRVNISSAELKLHPAELGTVEIKISTEDDQTRVSFLTGTAAAKEIIETSLPRLRDLLSSSGLQLEQSDVSQKNLSENRTNQQDANTEESAHKETSAVNEDAALLVRQHSLNQIDHYV